MRRNTSIALAASLVAAIMAASSLAGVGGGLSIVRSTIISGGGRSSTKVLSVTGATATSIPSSGGPYTLTSGFWSAQTATPLCPADLDDDGSVGAADLSLLLASWGAGGSADLDGDGSVGAADLSLLLAAWGLCD